MKRFYAIIAGLTACCLLSPASGAEDGKQRQRPGIDREQVLKQFDANGDGRLDDAEKAKAKEAFANRQRQGNRPGQGKAGQGRPGQGQGRPNFQQVLKQFDKDGDGRLNEQEQSAAREHFGKMRRAQAGNNGQPRRIPEEVLKRFDKDGDGQLNAQERAAAMKAREEFMKKNGNAAGRNGQAMPNMKELIARFDKDGDGRLNETERAELDKARQQRRGAGRPAPEAKEKPGRVDKKELLAKFDADGDGELNGDEKAAARAAFQNRDKK